MSSVRLVLTYCLTPGYDVCVSILPVDDLSKKVIPSIKPSQSSPHQISDVPSDLLVDTLLLWGMRTLPEVAGMFLGLEMSYQAE